MRMLSSEIAQSQVLTILKHHYRRIRVPASCSNKDGSVKATRDRSNKESSLRIKVVPTAARDQDQAFKPAAVVVVEGFSDCLAVQKAVQVPVRVIKLVLQSHRALAAFFR